MAIRGIVLYSIFVDYQT